jgi:hypothetical protein
MDVKANEHNKNGSDRNGENRKHNNTILYWVRHVGNAQHVWPPAQVDTDSYHKKLVTDMFLSMLFKKMLTAKIL